MHSLLKEKTGNKLRNMHEIERFFFIPLASNVLLIMANRTRSDIIIDVLQSLAMEPMLKTYVMYGSRLSHSQLKYYRDILSEKGLIMEIDNKWAITDKGREYLKAWDQVKEILEK